MAADLATTDPYSEHTLSRVLEATPSRAVVEQPMEPEVDNHVKVRHASALYAAAYEAARQLVIAALGDRAASVEVRLADSEIKYAAVGLGTLTSTAEPLGDAWQKLHVDGEVDLDCLVTTTDPDGKTVTTLSSTAAARSPSAATTSCRAASCPAVHSALAWRTFTWLSTSGSGGCCTTARSGPASTTVTRRYPA